MSQPEACALHLIEVVPRLMDAIRSLVRDERGSLTIPQMRILAFLGRKPRSTLADVATFIGIGAPTASAMIKTLDRKGLIQITPGKIDRRTVAITLNNSGKKLMVSAKAAARQRLAERLTHLNPAELDVIETSMRLLAAHVTQSLHETA